MYFFFFYFWSGAASRTAAEIRRLALSRLDIDRKKKLFFTQITPEDCHTVLCLLSCTLVTDFLSAMPTGPDASRWLHSPPPPPLYAIVNIVSAEHGNDSCTVIPKSLFSSRLHVTARTHCVWHLCIICLSDSNETLTSSPHKGYCVPLIVLNEPWALTKRPVLLQLTAVGPSAQAPWREKILSVSSVCITSFSLFFPSHSAPSPYMHPSPLEVKGVSFYFFRHMLLDHRVKHGAGE